MFMGKVSTIRIGFMTALKIPKKSATNKAVWKEATFTPGTYWETIRIASALRTQLASVEKGFIVLLYNLFYKFCIIFGMAQEQDRDSRELFSDIEQHLKNKNLESCREDTVPKEALSAETWLKRKVLILFFENNYAACSGLFTDLMDHAREMHREFNQFLSDRKTDYHKSGDFGMESLVSEINFDDALEHTEDNIKQANTLLSHNVHVYKGINVAQNRKVWKYLRRVVKAAAEVDKQIQQA